MNKQDTPETASFDQNSPLAVGKLSASIVTPMFNALVYTWL